MKRAIGWAMAAYLVVLAACGQSATADPAPSTQSPSPSPTSPVEEIELLEDYTCRALRDALAASKAGIRNAQIDAAQQLAIAAGQWEESLPAMGQNIREVVLVLWGGLPEAQAIGEVKQLANRFPGCLSMGGRQSPEPEPSPAPPVDRRRRHVTEVPCADC
jgi:hypothetical protein